MLDDNKSEKNVNQDMKQELTTSEEQKLTFNLKPKRVDLQVAKTADTKEAKAQYLDQPNQDADESEIIQDANEIEAESENIQLVEDNEKQHHPSTSIRYMDKTPDNEQEIIDEDTEKISEEDFDSDVSDDNDGSSFDNDDTQEDSSHDQTSEKQDEAILDAEAETNSETNYDDENQEKLEDSYEEDAKELEIPLDTDEEILRKRKTRRSQAVKKSGIFTELKKSLISEFKPIKRYSNSPIERRKQEVLQLRRQRGAAGSLLLLHAILSIIFILFWNNAPQVIMGMDKASVQGILFSTLNVQALTILLPSITIMLLYNMDTDLIIGRTMQKPHSYLLSILIGIPAALVFTGINNISLFALYHLGFSPSVNSVLGHLEDISPTQLIFIILATALVPAIVEEFMFRGVIQTSLSLSGRAPLAIFLTATAFALFHNNPAFIFAPLAAGLYLAYIRQRSDNLYHPMLIHFVMNTTLIFLQPILPSFKNISSLMGSRGQSMFYASIVATTVASIALVPLSNYFLQTQATSKRISSDPIYKRLQQEQWFPADWKFMLGLLILFFTMLVAST